VASRVVLSSIELVSCRNISGHTSFVRGTTGKQVYELEKEYIKRDLRNKLLLVAKEEKFILLTISHIDTYSIKSFRKWEQARIPSQQIWAVCSRMSIQNMELNTLGEKFSSFYYKEDN
jgi:hypothetical protein